MEKWTRAFYQPVLPMGEDGRRVTASKEHIALSKDAAKEGMVLLKNQNQVLPLAKGSKVALFGKGTFDYVKAAEEAVMCMYLISVIFMKDFPRRKKVSACLKNWQIFIERM